MDMNVEVYGANDYDMEGNATIESLDSERQTLFVFIMDESGSMCDYEKIVPVCIDELKKSIKDSKSEDEILVALGRFSSNSHFHLSGYKKVDDIDNQYSAGGCTAMYDAIIQAQEKLTNPSGTGYMDTLRKNGINAKAVFVVLGDGWDNDSNATAAEAKKAIDYLNKEEVITAFIAFGPDAIGIAEGLDFASVLNEADATASTLRKTFQILSKSVISASQQGSVVDTTNFFTV